MRNVRLVLVSLGLALGVALSCDKQQSRAPGSEDDGTNLCRDYSTCNECIAGQQTKGATEGEAETMCGAAVLGCWTTWDKPIVCGEKTHHDKPNGEEPG